MNKRSVAGCTQGEKDVANATMLILDGTSQNCFYKSMLTKAAAKTTVYAVVYALWPNKYCCAEETSEES